MFINRLNSTKYCGAMDIRNIQKTGNMHYLYLPTAWCKKQSINSNSKVSLEINNDNTITINPLITKRKQKSINIEISEKNKDIIIKLIIACYMNPTNSFKIKLEKKTDVAKLLDQKRTMAGFEFVELDGHNITYESSMTVNEPDSLLKTMVKKIRSLLNVMITNYNTELINKYEEEIDRSNLLINKSATDTLTLHQQSNLKAIELHYISLISQHLERFVDFLIKLDSKEKEFLKTILAIIEDLKNIFENLNKLDYNKVINLIKKIVNIKESKTENLKSHYKMVIKGYLINVSEVLLDWSITKKIE